VIIFLEDKIFRKLAGRGVGGESPKKKKLPEHVRQVGWEIVQFRVWGKISAFRKVT